MAKATTRHNEGAEDAPRSVAKRAKPLRRSETRGRGGQVVRHHAILRALEAAHRPMSVQELRDVIDDVRAGERTLRRDLDQLQQVGFPLVKDGARWSLLPSPSSTQRGRLPLQPSEILAMLLSEQLFAPVRDSWVGASLAELRRKLSAGLTPKGREYVELMRRTVAATVFAPARPDADVLETLGEAIEIEQSVDMRYETPGKGETDRVVEPYGLHLAEGTVYLIAHCHRAGEMRTFATQRIRAARLLDETFVRDPAFDLDALVARKFRVYDGPSHTVVLDFAPESAHEPRERELHPTQRVTKAPDGGVRVELYCGGIPEIARWVAGFGGTVRVVEPAELVQFVGEIGARTARAHQLYQKRDTADEE